MHEGLGHVEHVALGHEVSEFDRDAAAGGGGGSRWMGVGVCVCGYGVGGEWSVGGGVGGE